LLKCPKCDGKLTVWKTKDAFSCPHCGTALRSNGRLAGVLAFLLYTVCLPLFWGIADAFLKHFFGRPVSYDDASWIALLAGLPFCLLVYPAMLKVQIPDEVLKERH
jgi:hypothetical protein